jgi:stage V sporulation protein D (sporulation-specific penicillin-binding protein)
MNQKIKKRKNKKFNSKMQANLLLVFCVVILCFFALIGRLIFINIKDGEKYEKRVLSQQTYMSNAIAYKRGDIVDRNMTKLATSEKVYNMILDPVAMQEKKAFIEPTKKALVKCFEFTQEELTKILVESPESRYIVMKEHKGLTYEEIEEFLQLEEKDKKIQGVWFEEEYVRRYPLKTVASNVIGFTSKGNVGNWGIEEYYNKKLNGSNGREYGVFDSQLKLERTIKPAVNGNTIVSTIDSNVQTIVENKINDFDEETGGKNIAVIVMNPQNGEIYAMGTDSTYDLNNPRDLSGVYTEKEIKAMNDEEMMTAWNGIWRNYVISDAYEPGSTFKPFTMSAALDEGKVTLDSKFACPGYEIVLGHKIKCTSNHGIIDLATALKLSCNPAHMQIGAKLGRSLFYKYIDVFGFGSKTGIDLPGEGSGLIFTEEQLNPIELATSSFGQGQTVTMIQMASAFSSVINGGYYYEPHMVKEILNENGASIEKIDPILVKETISKSTSDKLRTILFDTVEDGTAKGAKVSGFEIGGKTGTAEKKERDDKNYIISFIGFTPIDDPEIMIYVVIDEPGVENQARSSIATEFASKIMEEILPFLDVYPEETTEDTQQ